MSRPPEPKRSVLPVVLGALAITAVIGGWRAWEISRSSPDADALAFRIDGADAAAPPFTLEAVGGRFDLAAAKGKVVFINFWATWCPPCRDEMPSMLQLGAEYAARYPDKFRMVAVSVDDDWETVLNYFGGPPPAWLTVVRDTTQQVTRGYYCAARGRCPDSYKFPETYIVDPSGRLVAYVVGPRDWSAPSVRRFLDRLIQG
jgi:thiol-disulfide isomerase/thioredoxin